MNEFDKDLQQPVFKRDPHEPESRRILWGMLWVGCLTIVGLVLFLPTLLSNNIFFTAAENHKESAENGQEEEAPVSHNSLAYWLDHHPLNINVNKVFGNEPASDLTAPRNPAHNNVSEKEDDDRNAEEKIIEQAANALTDQNSSLSLSRILSARIENDKGRNIGSAHDIIIDKNNGQAAYLVIQNKSENNDNSFSIAGLDKMRPYDTQDGELNFTLSEENNRQPFDYTKFFRNNDYMSLRLLQNSVVLDNMGEPAGRVNTVLYKEDQVHEVYFTLDPKLAESDDVQSFSLPYQDVEIIKSPEGYEIKLSKEQTLALAKEIL